MSWAAAAVLCAVVTGGAVGIFAARYAKAVQVVAEERAALLEQIMHLSNIAASRTASEAAHLERAQRPTPAPAPAAVEAPEQTPSVPWT